MGDSQHAISYSPHLRGSSVAIGGGIVVPSLTAGSTHAFRGLAYGVVDASTDVEVGDRVAIVLVVIEVVLVESSPFGVFAG